MDTTRLAHLLREAFRPIPGTDEIEIDAHDGELLNLDGGRWQLLITGWPDRPEATLNLRHALGADASAKDRRQAVMASEIDEALAYVDAQVRGRFTTALKASGDPLALDLLEAMAVHKQRIAESGLEIEEGA